MIEVDWDLMRLTGIEEDWQKLNKDEFGWLRWTDVVKGSQNMIKLIEVD